MAISDLLASILSLDAYNRGYGSAIGDTGRNDPDGLGEAGANIGDATVLDFDLPEGSITAEFYAIAYELNGEIVISYRGTDTLGELVTTDITNIITNGDFFEPHELVS